MLRHQCQQHSTPKANSVATKPSAKMHSKSPVRHTTTSTPHHHQQQPCTLGMIQTPRSTPTPNRATPHSATHRVGVAASSGSGITISDEIRLRELFSILKGYNELMLELS